MSAVGLAIWIAVALAAGFAAGFGMRAALSVARRRRAQRKQGAIVQPFILPDTTSDTPFGTTLFGDDSLIDRTMTLASDIAHDSSHREAVERQCVEGAEFTPPASNEREAVPSFRKRG